MRYFTGALRVLLFLILFLFALKNHELATLKFYFDLEWKAPLVLLLLIFFAAGIAAGVLACLPRMFRQRRETLALTGQLKQAKAEPKAPDAPRDAPRGGGGEAAPAETRGNPHDSSRGASAPGA